ncbi:MAG: hypothetical protein ACOZB3_10765 [Calditrichota bacterium]
MRNRLPLFLNELSLEEILFLEDELERRKEKHRRNYSVLVVQTDKPILRVENHADLAQFARDTRRYISGSSAVGGGAVLAFSPEMSAVLFNSVADAGRAAAALLSALPELNGRYESMALRFGVKMGLTTGMDTLAPGSPRSVRQSPLVIRANRLAFRSAANTLLMDQNSYAEWQDKQSVVLAPFDVDGERAYRVIPGIFSNASSRYNNDSLVEYLRQVANNDIPTLKYDMEHVEQNGDSGSMNAVTDRSVQLILEAYCPKQGRNLVFRETILAADFGERMDAVKRIVNSMGLALVRHSLADTAI